MTKRKREREENWGSVVSWKFQEEHLKVVSLLSATKGAEVKEHGGQEKLLDFTRRQLLMTLREQSEY